MNTVCKKCGTNSTLVAIDEHTACPACGAIFSKVALAIAAEEGRRLQKEKAQLLVDERSKKAAAFRMKFEPLTRVVRTTFRKLSNFGQAVARGTPLAVKTISRAVAWAIKVLTPVVKAVLALYGLMFIFLISMVTAIAKASPKTRKGRPRMTESEKEMAAYLRRTSEGTPKRRKIPSAKRIGY
jgi:hypothetical protein